MKTRQTLFGIRLRRAQPGELRALEVGEVIHCRTPAGVLSGVYRGLDTVSLGEPALLLEDAEGELQIAALTTDGRAIQKHSGPLLRAVPVRYCWDLQRKLDRRA
jgi:hypothetical protein